MSGTDSFNVKQEAPFSAELSEVQPHDNSAQPIFGSGASGVIGYAEQNSLPVIPQVTIQAEDPARSDLPVVTNIAKGNHADNEPLIYGSAQSLARDANRVQYGSAQVIKEDPNVSNLPPGHALPYGNNELGPAGITGDVIVAPQGTGPGFASGYISGLQDPDVLGAPAKVTLGAGNNDTLVGTDLPSAPLTGSLASGSKSLPTQTVDPNEGGNVIAVGSGATGLQSTGLAVSSSQPHAPQTQSVPQSTVQRVQTQEGGAAGQDIKPPVQYGQSAP